LSTKIRQNTKNPADESIDSGPFILHHQSIFLFFLKETPFDDMNDADVSISV